MSDRTTYLAVDEHGAPVLVGRRPTAQRVGRSTGRPLTAKQLVRSARADQLAPGEEVVAVSVPGEAVHLSDNTKEDNDMYKPNRPTGDPPRLGEDQSRIPLREAQSRAKQPLVGSGIPIIRDGRARFVYKADLDRFLGQRGRGARSAAANVAAAAIGDAQRRRAVTNRAGQENDRAGTRGRRYGRSTSL